MKKLLLVLLCVAVSSSLSSCDSVNVSKSGVEPHSRYTVVIDAGHGGKDAGTIGVDGTQEKGINLSVALILYDYLSVCGINCKLVRDKDYELYYSGEDKNKSDLYNRLDYVNSVENSALISIHQNHFESEKEWGCQVWYSKNNPESIILADNILTSVKHYVQPDNTRENKESGSEYYILYNAKVPSVMVECGFMSNYKENKQLQDINYQKKIAYAILAGICGEV